MAAITVMMKKV